MSTKGADAQNAFNQFDLSGVLSSLKEFETHLACQICHKIPEENTTSTPGSHLNHITVCGHKICASNPTCNSFTGGDPCPVPDCGVSVRKSDVHPDAVGNGRIDDVLAIRRILANNNSEGQQSEEMEKKKNDAPVPKKSKQDPTNVYEFEAESQLPPSKQSNSSLRKGMLASGVRSGIGEVTTADPKSNAQLAKYALFDESPPEEERREGAEPEKAADPKVNKRKLKTRARPPPVSTTSSTSEEETRQLALSKRKPPAATKRARKQKEAGLETPKENFSPNKKSKSREALAADYSEVLKAQPIAKVYDYEPPSQLPPSMRAHHGVSKGGQGPATGLSKKAKASKVANVDSTFKVPLVPAPNSSQQKIDKRNQKGETALHVACRLLKFFKAQELLAAGADPNTQDHAGWTPLHEVAQKAHVELVNLLLENGANPNVPGGDDNATPLHDAVSSGNAEVVRSLVRSGADKNALDSSSKTPADMAPPGSKVLLVLESTESELTDSERLEQSMMNQTVNAGAESNAKKYVIASDSSAVVKQLEKLRPGSFGGRHQLSCAEAGLSHETTHYVVSRHTYTVSSGGKSVMDADPAPPAYYEALLMGALIVNADWAQKCSESGSLVEETNYQIVGLARSLDGAPVKARENRMKRLPRLFDGMHIYLQGDFNNPYPQKKQLTEILTKGGAVVLKREPDPESIPAGEKKRPYHANTGNPLANCSHYIVYQEGSKSEPELKYQMSHIKSLPAAWLFECIHNFQLIDPTIYAS